MLGSQSKPVKTITVYQYLKFPIKLHFPAAPPAEVRVSGTAKGSTVFNILIQEGVGPYCENMKLVL